MEHSAFRGTAVDLFAVGQESVETADDIAHLIQSVERTGHAGEGHVLLIVETSVYQQRLVSLQVVDAFQVGRQDADHQIAGFNGRRGKHIRHVGTAVQDYEINQLGGGIDQLEHHPVLGFRIAERVLTCRIAHQADERIAFENRDMTCDKRGVDLHAAQDLPHRGVGLNDLLR